MPAVCHATPSSPHALPACSGELIDLLDASGEMLVQTTGDGTLTYASDAARAALGPAADHAPNMLALATPATRRRLAREVVPALRTEGRWSGELGWRVGADETALCRTTLVVRRGTDGTIDRCTALLRDVSVETTARRQLARQAEIMQAVTEAIPATVVVVDADGRYRFANGAFARQCGLAREAIIGRRAVDVLGAAEVERRRPYMQRAFAGEPVDFTLDYPGPDGTTHLALSCIPLRLAGQFDGFVGISQNTTLQRREQERLVHLAERDPLTGLLNRAGFEHRIDALMRRGDGRTLALFYVDLDCFKPVNDRFGHLAGDRLLQVFAERLSGTVRASDVVARLGGDEFAVLLAGVRDAHVACTIADKVVAAAQELFVIDGHHVRIGASVGIAVGLDAAAGWRDLAGRADAMLYRAKAEGRGRWVFAGPTTG